MTVLHLLSSLFVILPIPDGALASQAARADSITIVSVSPSDPVRRGLPIEFVVKVDVLLESADSAAVELLVNTEDPHRFREVAKVSIHRGHQRITLTSRVAPVDWGSEGQLALMISIAPTFRRGQYQPTVSVRQSIRVTP